MGAWEWKCVNSRWADRLIGSCGRICPILPLSPPFHLVSCCFVSTNSHMSCEQMSRRPRPCSPAAKTPLDDDDLLSEILLRLPPHPSSLPRASAVCPRWRLLVSDPRFLRRFRIHHRRNLPLLGFFAGYIDFKPVMDPPNRLPNGHFSLQQPWF